MNLKRERCTTIGANQIGTMAQGRVVESEVRVDNSIFIANTDSKPAAGIFLYFEGHFARLDSVLVYCGLH
jgi:hypothetical protein